MNCACGHNESVHDEHPLQDRPCRTCLCPGFHDTPRMVRTIVNGLWPLYMPSHRAYRPEWETGWEPERIASMARHIGTGDVVYDIGAEQGDMPCLWSTWGAQVVLVEPNPLAWPNIRATFDANYERPAGWFVGFCSDTTDLHPPGDTTRGTPRDGWPECAYDPVIGATGFRHLAQETATTPQIRLDDFVVDVGWEPTAITMDVEGAELRVLHGAEWVLSEMRPRVWVSVHTDLQWMDELYPGQGRTAVLAYMEEVGYEAELLAIDHEEHWMFTPKEKA